MKCLTIVCVLLSFILLVPATTRADVVYVAHDATGDGSGSSWANACTTISAGLVAAASGDEIWVKWGSYNEAITLKTWVALYGGFFGNEVARDDRNWVAYPTVIDGDTLSTSVVTGANHARLDGFRVVNGSVGASGGGIYCSGITITIENCTISQNSAGGDGGGIYCFASTLELVNCEVTDNYTGDEGAIRLQNSSTTITNCAITWNQGYKRGGGVSCIGGSISVQGCVIEDNSLISYFVLDEGGGGMSLSCDSATIEDSTFARNTTPLTGGGIEVVWMLTSLSLTNCTFIDNAAQAGGGFWLRDCSVSATGCTFTTNSPQGIWLENSQLSAADCVFTGNSGAAIYSSGDPVSATGCTFTGNGGGGIQSEGSVSAEDCIFVGNSGGNGGGARVNPGSFTNCVFVDNTAATDGGAVHLAGASELKHCTIVSNTGWHWGGGIYGSGTVVNCIVWDNIHTQITEGGGSLSVTWSDVEGGYTGEGNIDEDPLIADPLGGDYHLLASSPCINSGTCLVDVTTDFEGDPRPWGEGCDMGADECSAAELLTGVEKWSLYR